MTPRISAVINTLNEEKNLAYSLRSVRAWVDEIVVVDMHSEDRTIEIAREFGAKVFLHPRILAFDGARSFAVSHSTGDWVLMLDADEMIPQPLSEKLREIASKDAADVVLIPRLNYLLGGPLWHTGWGPDQDGHPRFFKRGKIDLSPRIHGFIRPSPAARILKLAYGEKLALHHFNYLDCAHFLEKLNRYTTIEAQQAFERGEPVSRGKALRQAAAEFKNRYFRHGGYRDGWRGLYLSGLMAAYRWATCAKLQELYSTGGEKRIVEIYHSAANELVADYEKHSPLLWTRTSDGIGTER
jgi:glycosyltransferase involved in cell wall biosynthesis